MIWFGNKNGDNNLNKMDFLMKWICFEINERKRSTVLVWGLFLSLENMIDNGLVCHKFSHTVSQTNVNHQWGGGGVWQNKTQIRKQTHWSTYALVRDCWEYLRKRAETTSFNCGGNAVIRICKTTHTGGSRATTLSTVHTDEPQTWLWPAHSPAASVSWW